MPRAKGTAKRGKAATRGKGRGRGKKVEEDVQEEEESQETENTEEEEEEQNTDGDGDQDTAEEDQDVSESGGQKRKADDVNGEDEDEDEDKSSAKKMKTEPDPNRPVTMFCGNLDPDLTSDTLRGFFEMNNIDVTNPRKIGFKRFGYVDVKPQDVDKALELNGKELNGEPITVEKSKPRTQESQSGGRVQGGDSKTLFVKGLKESITEEELQAFFEDADAGINVTEVRLPKSRGGGSKGFGYVVFDSEDALETVMKDKQDVELDGEKIFLDYTDQKSRHGGKGKDKDFGPSKVLFVRNLSFQVSEDELKEIFEGCEACRIPPNEYGQSKGFGFVEFKSVEEAEDAKKDKDGLEINGRVVQLAFANDKPGGAGGARSGGGGGGGYGGGGRNYGGGGGGGRFGRGGGWGGGGSGGYGWGGRRGGGGGGGGWGGGGRGGGGYGGGRGGGGWGRGGGGRGGGGGWGRGGGGGGGGGFRKRY
ncbi:nucleolin-like isoform X2 [Mercenaria mercenaria]|uniref:nucleolin-like isoform X2 n=1 Tax=Mercenaria mercenaria TaxID=6596 RepID=UPI00234F1011|nr:nucleolin-like isoform X2 [Mercenaria mercenaria]